MELGKDAQFDISYFKCFRFFTCCWVYCIHYVIFQKIDDSQLREIDRKLHLDYKC